MYNGSDRELQAIVKRINKKDETTKLKALNDLSQYIQLHKEEKIIFRDFLSVWCNKNNGLFLTLSNHNDRRIRYNSLVIMNDLISIGLRKSFIPYLSIILPTWYNLLNDPAKDIQLYTKQTLEVYFTGYPLGTFLETLQNYLSDMVDTYIEYLHATPEELSDMRITTIEEANERYERTYMVTLYSLTSLTELIFQQFMDNNISLVQQCYQQIKVNKETANTKEETIKLENSNASSTFSLSLPSTNIFTLQEKLRSTFQSNIPWKILLNHKASSIRRATCQLLSNLCKYDPLSITQSQRYQLVNNTENNNKNGSPLRIVLPLADLPKALFVCASKDTSSIVWSTLVSFIRLFPSIWGIQAQDYQTNYTDYYYHDYYLRNLQENSQFWYLYDEIMQSIAKQSEEIYNPSITTITILPIMINSKIDFWGMLFTIGKHSAYGNGESVYPNLLPICLLLPLRILFENIEKSTKSTIDNTSIDTNQQIMNTGFFQLLITILHGLQNTNNDEILTISGQQQLYQAIIDLCIFCIARITRSIDNTNNTSSSSTNSTLSNALLLNYNSLLCGILLSFFQFVLTIPISWELLLQSLPTGSKEEIEWYTKTQNYAINFSNITNISSASISKTIKIHLLMIIFRSLHQLQDIVFRRKVDNNNNSSSNVVSTNTSKDTSVDRNSTNSIDLSLFLSRIWHIITILVTTELRTGNQENGEQLLYQLIDEFTISSSSTTSSSITLPFNTNTYANRCLDTILENLITPGIETLQQFFSLPNVLSIILAYPKENDGNVHPLCKSVQTYIELISTLLNKQSKYVNLKIFQLLPFSELKKNYENMVQRIVDTPYTSLSKTIDYSEIRSSIIVQYTKLLFLYGQENNCNLTNLCTYLIMNIVPIEFRNKNVLESYRYNHTITILPTQLSTISKLLSIIMTIINTFLLYVKNTSSKYNYLMDTFITLDDGHSIESLIVQEKQDPNFSTLPIYINMGNETYTISSKYEIYLFYRMLMITNYHLYADISNVKINGTFINSTPQSMVH